MLLESLRLRQLKIIRKFHAFCLNMSRRPLLASGGVSPCQQRLSFSCWSLAYLRKTLPESSEIFVEHTPQGATILDKNVKKNTPGMFHFRILHSKDPYTQDTFPSPPKNNVEGSPEHFWSRLNNTDRGGVGGGATMMLNSLGVSPVYNKV